MSTNSKKCENIKDLRYTKIKCQFLQNSIEKIIDEEGYVSCDVSIQEFDTEGGNFLGELYQIDIKGKTVHGNQELNLFVKQKIKLDKTAFLNLDDAYRNEELIYKDLSEMFTLLQDEAHVPLDERYKLAKAYSETSIEAIILENLTIKGFKTYDRLDVLPLKFIELAIEQMAKFHGLSLVIEDKMPEFFNNKIKSLKHIFCYDDDWANLMTNVTTYVANLCKDETKAKVENFLKVLLKKYPKYNKDKTSTKCTLTHGGYKSANILVREHNEEPVEVVVVDYQFLDYGCPMRDLSFAILANTDKNFRRNHMEHVKELYFKTLSRFLKYFELDVEDVYPRKEFEKAYTECLDYGLMKILFALPFMFGPKTGLDLKNMSLSEIDFNVDSKIQTVIRDLIEDFVDWGYLE